MTRQIEMVQTSEVSAQDIADAKKALQHMRSDSPYTLFLRAALESDKGVLFLTTSDMSPDQVGKALHVSRPYVRRLMDENLLHYHKVGSHYRITSADLTDYINRHEKATQEFVTSLSTHEEQLQHIDHETSPLTDDEMKELSELL